MTETPLALTLSVIERMHKSISRRRARDMRLQAKRAAQGLPLYPPLLSAVRERKMAREGRWNVSRNPFSEDGCHD